MNSYPFTLQKYAGPGTRFDCPDCGKKKTFTRYIEKATNEYVDWTVGICNRASKCKYHLTPKEFFLRKGIKYEPIDLVSKVEIKLPKIYPPSFIPSSRFENSLKAYRKNNFALFLIDFMGNSAAKELINRYQIGTSKYWPGSTVFWQIDTNGRIRTGKIMVYDPVTGKRIKEPKSRIQWVHSINKRSDFHLKQCLFGEHLLKLNPDKPVAIVESEKSAIIASHFFPEFVWVACGGIHNLKIEICRVLKGREVVLIPDLDAHKDWEEKAKDLKSMTQVRVSTKFIEIATEDERQSGWDIGDYLIADRYTDLRSPRMLNQI